MELTYNDLLIDLEKLKNEKNIFFSKKILNTKLDLFGLKAKQVLEIAKKYKDIDVSTFELDKYYEVNYLYFYIYLKKNKNIDNQINFLIVNRSHLENWAIVDGTSKLLVDFKLNDSKKFLKFNDEFIVRYPYICMLKFTKNLQNLNEIFSYLKNDDRYYVKMGEGWLLSYCFINHFDETYKYYENTTIDKSILLIGIQKAIDSFRVSEENKLKLKELRRTLRNDE